MNNNNIEIEEITVKSVLDFLNYINDEMKKQVSIDNPQSILEKINTIQVILPLNSQCLAWAETLYNKKFSSLTLSGTYDNRNSSDKKIIYNSICQQELFILNLSKAQSNDLHRQVDLLRTMLSYLKTEVKNIPQ